MTGPGLTFVPVTAADLPLLAAWMDQPHWREWWSADVETELGYLRDIIEGRDSTRAFLFHLDGQPTGYIQSGVLPTRGWSPGCPTRPG
ncbi:GNAT family N-acetyltransferase [Paracoccus sp. SSK6]|uniref:GNAT family N-acetyltransferase n=1 Tax=Paracoccus sp. SSK6 TaxID=3143131 RepID=UPI003218F3A7